MGFLQTLPKNQGIYFHNRYLFMHTKINIVFKRSQCLVLHYIAKKRLQEGCCKTRLRSLKIRLFAHSKKNTTDFSMGFNIIVIESINDTLCRF